ncbi:cytochrome P450 [Penicillium herquei]|nr:cytochrome P450 [Penicillium herquei]
MFILDPAPLSMFNAISIILVLYFIITALYNVFFHPLRNYPGPQILAASRLPIAYWKITGQSAHRALHLHIKYGPVVRMAPSELSYSNSSSWRDIYASHPARPAGMPRDTAFFRALEDDETGFHSLLTASDKDHARIRRTYARAFSEQALAVQQPLIAEHVTFLKRILHEQQHQNINIVDMFAFTVADITANLQLGEPLHLLNDETHRAWVRSQAGMMRSSRILATLAEFPILQAIFQVTLFRLVKRARATYFGWMSMKLNHRLAMGVHRPDIVHFVMQGGPMETITEAELRANVPLIIFAGNETISAALSGLVGFLLNAPEVLRQLQDEVRSTFQDNSEIEIAKMRKMRVLNACINEALRVYAPAPGELPRLVPKGGALISGQWVPGGIRVYTSPLAAFRTTL